MDIAVQPDHDNDSLYVAFGAGALSRGSVAKSVRVTEDVTFDFDKNGRLLGLDVMNAADILGPDYREMKLDALVGVKEASALLGVQKSNFVRDFASRADFPAPVAELATGRVWLRSQVSEYAVARKRTAGKKAS